MEHPTTPQDAATESTIMEDMIWYCVAAMLTPLVPPPDKTAPVTSFDWGPAFKALHERDDTRDQAMAQALRMRDAERANARLAMREKERQRRDEEMRSQAQQDADQMGEFSLD